MKTKQTRLNYKSPAVLNAQRGVALIMVLTVLFALTVLGLAATDSSNLQAVMVRNNQFRLEAFNASYSEIEDQLEFYATQPGKPVLFAAIDRGAQTASSYPDQSVGDSDKGKDEDDDEDKDGSDDSSLNTFPVRIGNSMFSKNLTLEQDGGCPITLNSIGGFKKCSLMRLDSNAVYRGTNIGSDQAQQFSFVSF